MYYVSKDTCRQGVWELEEELCLFTEDPPDVGRDITVFMLSLSVSDFRV